MAQEIERATPQEGALYRLKSERMRNFVWSYVAHGRRDAGKAYVEAGYRASNANVARVNACILLHRGDVQEAIQEVVRRDLIAMAPIANRVAIQLLENDQIDPSTRARLLMGVWDRTGMNSVSEIKHTVEHVGNDPQAIGAIRTMIEGLGMTEQQAEAVFGRTATRKALKDAPGPVIDVEPEEVEPEGMEDVRW